MNRNTIITALRRNIRRATDRQTGEVNLTLLVEETAVDLDRSEWLDDSDHIIWDLAIEVAED